MKAEANANVIAKLFAVKCANGHFGPVQCGPVIQIAEIVSDTRSDPDFTLINRCLGLGPDLETHKND
jgi:hypothetical protein